MTEFIEEYVVILPRLNEKPKELLETQITITQIEKGIHELNPRKSPGPDGISAAFYNTFRHEVTPAY